MKPKPPIAYIGMFLSSAEVFGQAMPADFLIGRVRSYGWKPSVTRLAEMAAYIEHPGRTPEEVRRRTIDPILQITGDSRAMSLITRAHAFIRAHRERMLVAHEEVISYLQHLVLVEGGDGDDVPGDAELSFWMLGANCHLGEWAEPDSRVLTTEEELIAVQVRGHCFSKAHNWAALAVRSYELFTNCPEDESLGGRAAWERIQEEAFGASFQRYYQLIMAPLLGVVSRAGEASQPPAVGLEYWEKIGIDLSWVKARLDAIGTTREAARAMILAGDNARGTDGLLHAPSLLRRKPLLIDEEGWLVTSRQGFATHFHTGPWGTYLEKTKAVHGKNGFKRWSSAFGVAFERYCASLARTAAASPRFRRNWRMVLPSAPGANDEIEDVILIEDDHAVFFSVKSRLLPEGDVHRAKSRSAIIDWLDSFLFAPEKSHKGAVLKLSANIDELRQGRFEDVDIKRDLRVLPVLVTYDELGEDVFLYKRVRDRCKALGLLTQPSVAPLTIASIEEFEWMMEYVHAGRSLVGLLKKRKHDRPWFDRRIDQQLGSVTPRVPFTMTLTRFNEIFEGVLAAVRGSERAELRQPDGPTDPDAGAPHDQGA